LKYAKTLLNAIQALQIALQRILNFRPALYIGGDIDENMIAGDQDLLFRLVQTGMTEAVPRGMNAPEMVCAHVDDVPVLQNVQLGYPFRTKFETRVLLDGTLELIFRKAVLGA